MIADMPVSVEFGEQEVDCSRTVLRAEDVAAAAGELAGYRFSLHSVISDWDPLPVDDDLLTIASVEYRVLRSNADQVGIRWDMGDKYAERAS